MEEIKNEAMKCFNYSKGATIINDTHTDIYCSHFEDRLLIIISQFEKLGVLLSVTRDMALNDSADTHVFNVRTMLGEEDPETTVIARNLASHIDVSKPIMFGLALKDKSSLPLRPLLELLNRHRCW